MQPNIVSGQAIGTVVSATSSTDLASINTQGLAIGTKAWNVAVGAYFTLTLSTASLVTDSVVAVSGLTGARWIVDTAVTAPVTNAVLATMAAHTYKGNATAGVAVPTDLTRTALLADVIPAASTTTTLGASAADITVSGLTGNTDGGYVIDFYLICGASGSGVVTLQPNGLATGQYLNGSYIYSGGNGGLTYTVLEIDSGSAVGVILQGQFVMPLSAAGTPRFVTLQMTADPAGSQVCKFLNGAWTDTTTQITSLTIHAATALGFAAGSWLKVTKQFRT